MAKQKPPLGGSAKISVGGKAYSSTPPQGVQTAVQTVIEPRNLAHKGVENLAHTVRTATSTSVTSTTPAKDGGSSKRGIAVEMTIKPSTAAIGGSGGVKTATPSKPHTAASASGGVVVGMRTDEKSKPLSYSAQQAAQPQTAVKTKEVSSGYRLATSVKAGILTSQEISIKTPVQIMPMQGQPQKPQGSVQRSASINVTPQTVISQKPVTRGFQKPVLPQSNIIVKTQPNEQTAKPQGSVQRSASINVTSQTIISQKPVIRGFQKPVLPQSNVIVKIQTQEQTTKPQGSVYRGASINVTPQTIISQKPVIRGFQKPVLPQSNIIVKARTQAQNALNNESDNPTSAVSTTISAVGVTVKTVKAAQAASPVAIKIAQGTYAIGVKTVRVVRSVDSTLTMIQAGIIPLNKQTMQQFRDFATDKLVKSKPVQNLIHAVEGVQTGLNNAVTGVKTAVNTTVKYGLVLKNGTVRAAKLVRGIATGTVQIRITKQALLKARNMTWKGVKWTGKFVGLGIKTGVVYGVKTGWKGSKSFGVGLGFVGNALIETQDTGVQSLGMGLKVAEYGIKGVHTAPKVAKGVYTGVKNTVKTARKTLKAVDKLWFHFKYAGFRNTVGFYKGKAVKAVAKAGGSAIQATLELVKQIGAKVVVPALLLIGGLMMVFNLISAPVSGVGAIFGGTFTNKDSGVDFEIHDYLMVNIEPYKTAFANKLLAIQTKALNEDGYHYVRLFAQTNASDVNNGNSVNERHTLISETDIKNSLSDSADIVAIIEPIFQTIMLTKYDLEPTEAQIDETIQELWNNLFRVETKDLPIEYCNDATQPHSCGSYHANIAMCPNINSGKHSSFICSSCCYTYDCGGTSCSGNHHDCNGYNYCDGHRILAISFNMDGVYELMAKYFTEPIDRLANMPNKTQAQQDELDTLKDNYELCLAYLEEVRANFGLGSSMTDLSGVIFVNGTREGNQAVVDRALSQVGQVGGQPYWSYYGFSSRVEWCACFVHWAMHTTGNGDKYATSSNNAYCPTLTEWFSSHGQWAAGGYTNLAPGDVIFFDWNGDGNAQHVGLVIGTDGENVYTVEGNSGDAVRLNSYPISSSVILGYGIPNY